MTNETTIGPTGNAASREYFEQLGTVAGPGQTITGDGSARTPAGIVA